MLNKHSKSYFSVPYKNMDLRAEKLAKARKKLRDHQEKKVVFPPKEDATDNNTCLQNIVQIPQSLENVKDVNPIINNETGAGTVCENEINFKNKTEVNVTDCLNSDKTRLEMQIQDLNSKLMQLEFLHESEIKENLILKDKVNVLQCELNDVTKKLSIALNENSNKECIIIELKNTNQRINEEKNNFIEEVEVTKAMLTKKESDNIRLQNEIYNYHNQLETAKLQLQQLTNDSVIQPNISESSLYERDVLTQKVLTLQQQIDSLQKERDQINSHYEHYVKELNEQLKNENLNKEKYYEELQRLYQRESSLVEQISDMEIRLQNFGNIRNNSLDNHNVNIIELQEKYKYVETQLEEAAKRYDELQKQYCESLATVKSLSDAREQECTHDNISISQLSADITSDKIAVQLATEQNKKLKQDIEDLELVVVKMTKDKLELTEMLNHEKNLNKDLILKLTEIEESTKNINNKLRAKDDEMIRLQSGYREIENKHGKLLQDLNSIKERTSIIYHDGISDNNNVVGDITNTEQQAAVVSEESITEQTEKDIQSIPKYDAMHKLQERFLKIMHEVANLSDEKHRLEHIILQLQNETDTICEYVALYQQQRCLLKKREEERDIQISLFQKECDQLKRHVEELRDIILHVIEDPKLLSYFKNEGSENDILRAKHLLDILQNTSLVEAKFHRLDLNVSYPCSCCSGQLIDV